MLFKAKKKHNCLNYILLQVEIYAVYHMLKQKKISLIHYTIIHVQMQKQYY